MILALVTLITALGISAVAAFYSIVGLMAIFSASALSIAVMGIVLEIGKLITASWLYQNWKKIPLLLKSYLTIAVIVLMFITSMGIFGYLSKAHIDQGSGTSELYVKVERLDNRIASERKIIKRAETQLSALDSALDKYLELGAVSKGLKKREDQEQERNALTDNINNAQSRIDKLLDEKSEYKLQINSFEVEVGPLKYISALVYGDEALDYIDTAVRAVILILVFVFDPLAVLLIIAANMSFAEYNEKRKRALARKNRVPKGAIKTTVSEEQNGLRKVTKSVNGVSMEYYE
jgi:chaperonin cofactor prefoldin